METPLCSLRIPFQETRKGWGGVGVGWGMGGDRGREGWWGRG